MNSELKETLMELAVLNERRQEAHRHDKDLYEGYARGACLFREAVTFGLGSMTKLALSRVKTALLEKRQAIEAAIGSVNAAKYEVEK